MRPPRIVVVPTHSHMTYTGRRVDARSRASPTRLALSSISRL
jgi:hypothetical protein